MDDLISRQAAIDEIKEIYEWHDNVTKERIIEHADMRTAKQIIHDAIDNTPMAEDVYVGIKEKLHKAVDECIVGDIYENKNR